MYAKQKIMGLKKKILNAIDKNKIMDIIKMREVFHLSEADRLKRAVIRNNCFLD